MYLTTNATLAYSYALDMKIVSNETGKSIKKHNLPSAIFTKSDTAR